MWELIKNIYNKTKILANIELFELIYIFKTLFKDSNIRPYINQNIKYLFKINPTHIYYLLYYSTPKRYKIPYFKPIDKIEDKPNELLQDISKLFHWTNKEQELYKEFI